MKFLCLAYGDEKDWVALPEKRRGELLAQDHRIRARGDLVAAVGSPISVRAWNGDISTTEGAFLEAAPHLAGFSVIEARDVEEAVSLVAGTPCAVARGVIEIRPLLAL